MGNYVKLFGSILDSTVWDTSPATRVVWITLLAMADRDGIVEASVPGLAKRAGVERGECERALALFSSPDVDSRSPEFEGRRIEAVDGGWRLLNFEKYRDKQTKEEAVEKTRLRVERFRAREAAKAARNAHVTLGNAGNDSVTLGNASNTLSSVSSDLSAAADSDAGANQQPPISVHTGRLTTFGISAEWHAAVRFPGAGDPMTLHAEANWRPDYETILTVLTQLPEHNHWPAARAVCRWFWLAPDGPIQSGRIKRGSASPAHLAKRISSDLRAANDWWFAQSDASEAAL